MPIVAAGGGPHRPGTVLEVKLGYTNAMDGNIPVPVIAAREPSSSRNGSRSEIRLYKCEEWEHTGATEDGMRCG